MEYSAKAYQYSRDAHQESGNSFNETAALPELVKSDFGVGKRSKKKA
jgi:hypothetical protein